ncbi:hypothetical protein EJ04DRAFT_525654 [Polyplosphaeria fusca]|uniref:Uncharacterized protein n=1 Tax=Polyplosphaeria fusca TaxID=682080 RepID=A0A9P4QQR4_9PLEO|nr:hypothetical protein EJ04DRAFT_525654 [Polyplosphaeria fusca]
MSSDSDSDSDSHSDSYSHSPFTSPADEKDEKEMAKTPLVTTTNITRTTRVRDSISPVDGKTNDCDRYHTFEAFVPQQRLAEDKPEKKMGHSWDVLRAVMKLKKAPNDAATAARRISVHRSEKRASKMLTSHATDRERLLSVA